MTHVHHAAAPAATPQAVRLVCPVCGSPEERPVVRLRRVPVMCGTLHATREEALAAEVGDIELVACPRCSMLRNATFDERRIGYDAGYDNSLHFSPTFQAYAHGLARRLVERYDLHGVPILEIGSGKGDFLRELCLLGGNRAWGYDPSYAGEPDTLDDDVTFVAGYFSGELPAAPRLVCARHVLEHLAEPAQLLGSVRHAAGAETVLYVEVPDAAYVLTPRGIFDLIYPHVGYFTATALRHLIERCGFAPLEMATSFGGQYLWVEALNAAADPPAEPPRHEVEAVLERSAAFTAEARDMVARWSERLADAEAAGRRVALWGAGSKGVTFLNVVPGGDRVADVIDVNPRKRGTFVPGTGQMISGPDEVGRLAPDLVIVMNPNYEAEIRGALDQAGLDAAAVAVI
ncbi:MAG: class I SAM-dependent methyltransferase [Acidimicrobiia bacterium]